MTPTLSRIVFSSAMILASIAGETMRAESPAPIFPKALSPGDTIMFIAPAGNLDEQRCRLAKLRLEELGFKVRFPLDLFRKHGYFAGSDEARAAELMAAFNDPEVDAIFPGTGGYGTTRILDELDFDAIRRHPKVFIGFSDITALHIAINQKTGLVTFHTPNPEYGLGNPEGFNPYAARWFWRALLAAQYSAPLSRVARDARPTAGYTIVPKPTADEIAWDKKLFVGDKKQFPGFPKVRTIAPGKARGRIIGGNLSVVHALMGTPFEIQTDGKILFLEDVGEAPYRVDRMLSTLKLAGKLDHLAGVILGSYSRREDDAAWDEDWTMNDVLDDYFADLGVPVVVNFPAGHQPFNTTFPIGAEAELDASAGTIRLLENPVQIPPRANANRNR